MSPERQEWPLGHASGSSSCPADHSAPFVGPGDAEAAAPASEDDIGRPLRRSQRLIVLGEIRRVVDNTTDLAKLDSCQDAELIQSTMVDSLTRITPILTRLALRVFP